MPRSVRPLRIVCLAAAASLTTIAAASAQPVALRADAYVTGLSLPVAFVQDPSDPTVQYVVQQGGRIRAIKNGVLQPTDFLNIASLVRAGGEQGLLGLAFPPDYAASGRFYVYYNNTSGNIVIARYKRSANPLVADAAVHLEFLWDTNRFISHQPFGNHNGGNLMFGPDGYLYAGLGDGGGGNDPQMNAQNPQALLGKILRLDVGVPDANTKGYAIPPTNPFLGATPPVAGARGEIWAFGVRNPWKFTFDDPARGGTGALVIGDVGQNAIEEVDYEPAAHGGRNYGWPQFEGTRANVPGTLAYQPPTGPIFAYSHDTGNPTIYGHSITGGYVYRGSRLGTTHDGRYFFADFIDQRVWSIALTIGGGGEATASGLVEHTGQLGGSATLGNVSAFGVDANGELYVVSYSRGIVFRISPQCTISPTSAAYDASGGSGSVMLTGTCGAWTAISNDAFITVTAGSTGNGNGIVSYTVAPNVGAPNVANPGRSGTVTILGQTFTVNQTGCTFAIAPTSTTFGSAASAGAVGVTTPTACSWTVASLPAFASTTSGSSGTGSGSWQYAVAANAGAERFASITIGGQNFMLRQLAVPLKTMVAGTRTALTLADAAAAFWAAMETVAGRSYCARLAPARDALDRAAPTINALRADNATPLAASDAAQACFVAPATETMLIRVGQADASSRSYLLETSESTVWANWFFIAGDYSSYTLLRNTSASTVHATLTWRSDTGAIVGTQSITLAPGAVSFLDARAVTVGAVQGSVEIAHDGELSAIVGSQTTLSPTGGLSFDTILGTRRSAR